MTFREKTVLVKTWASFGQLMKYGSVGVLNTLLSYGVFAGLVYAGAPSAVALAVGYFCGMVTSYTLNAKWTFRSDFRRWDHVWRFALANISILGVSEWSLWLILRYILHSEYAGQALNTAIILIVGFLINRFFVFSSSELYKKLT